MKSRPAHEQILRTGSALLAGSICTLLLFVFFAYGPVRPSRQTSPQKSFDLAQLAADARTVSAAISYILEPEPPDLVPNSIYESGLRGLLGQNTAHRPGVFAPASTNRPSSG